MNVKPKVKLPISKLSKNKQLSTANYLNLISERPKYKQRVIISPETRQRIKDLYAQGRRQIEIAARFGVSQNAVSSIVNGINTGAGRAGFKNSKPITVKIV